MALADRLSKSDGWVSKNVGKAFSRHPDYFNGLIDRMLSGNYAKSLSTRWVKDQPFFLASGVKEGLNDSVYKYINNYIAKKMDEDPEFTDALGKVLLHGGRAVNVGRIINKDNPEQQQAPTPIDAGQPLTKTPMTNNQAKKGKVQ